MEVIHFLGECCIMAKGGNYYQNHQQHTMHLNLGFYED